MRTVRTAVGAGLALVVLALGVSGLVPAVAAASYPWENQNMMRFEQEASLRETFIVDTQPGAVISRQLFLTQPYLSFYEGEGFDRNFFTWAPRTAVGDEYLEGRGWTRCGGVQVAVPGGPSYCAPGAVQFGGPGSIREDVLTGLISGYKWGETFVSEVSGGWSPADTAPKDSPAPVIEGVKYEDRNLDGFRELDEPGLPGWKIYLYYGSTEVASTTTGAGGAYSFRLDADTMPIGAGTYTLKEEAREGWRQQRASRPIFVSVGAGDVHFEGNDFGNWRLATISGRGFDDSDLDGSRDEGESPLGEWGIRLSNEEARSTAADGSYSFSVPPGTYTVGELLPDGWRQTAPAGAGTHTVTVVSGQVVEGLDFGNVCLGGVAVDPLDLSTGEPFPGLEVRLEEVSVPGELANVPPLPRSGSGAAEFDELLPGAYRIFAFLPDGVFTTEPTVLVGGRFAIVKRVRVNECETTELPIDLFTRSTPGKASGEVRLGVPGGFATAEFELEGRGSTARGELEYGDQVRGLKLHTEAIEAIRVSGQVAWVWGMVRYEGALRRFSLRAVDAGEPGRADRLELTVAPGYEAGQGGPIAGGNVQVRSGP